MKDREILQPDRRHFIGLLSGILSGLFVMGPTQAKQTKTDIKQVLKHIEIEKLFKSTPRKHPEITGKPCLDAVLLLKKDTAYPIIQ